ncbi:MAG: pyridoxal-5'-phosphate-dependent protein [Chloroflexi bacterium RBG_16_47_49]|nr:MAG: pyridoxal-5'-phosphate-dependent protein [Chloroflexi bacterium RBG_16_47_49]
MRTLPRIRIAQLPTPVELLPRLTAELGGPTILVKRDDLTGLAFGGNKTRKLEYLLAEAQANGARTIITAGAVQSNHCRQTAAACARLKFDCVLVLSGEKPSIATGNLLLDHLFNAEIVWTSDEERDAMLQSTFQKAWEAGRRPYLIPYGGSNTTGATAYVYAVQELLTQGYTPDWIVFASSSGGTQAGLAAGARLFGFRGKVLGISVDETEVDLKERVASLATATTDTLGEKTNITAQDILVNDNYTGGGYGIMGTPEIEAIRLFARLEGLLLDPVYTGRAAAGLIDLIRKGYFKHDETVLFWHTGGTPAIFSDKYSHLVSPL